MSTSKKLGKIVALGTVGTLLVGGIGTYAYSTAKNNDLLLELLDKTEGYVQKYVTDSEATVDSLDANLKNTIAEKLGLTEQLETKTAELETANATIESLNTQIGEKNTQISNLETQLEALKNVESENATYIQQIEELTTAKTQLESEVADLTSQLEEANATIEDLNATITDLNNTIAEKDATISELQTEKANLLKENEDLSDYVLYLEGEMTESENKAIETHDTIAELTGNQKYDAVFNELVNNIDKEITYDMANANAVWLTEETTSNEPIVINSKYTNNDGTVYYITTTTKTGTFVADLTLYDEEGNILFEVSAEKPIKIVVSGGVTKIIDGSSKTLYTFK